jgi:hypothetical protein
LLTLPFVSTICACCSSCLHSPSTINLYCTIPRVHFVFKINCSKHLNCWTQKYTLAVQCWRIIADRVQKMMAIPGDNPEKGCI